MIIVEIPAQVQVVAQAQARAAALVRAVQEPASHGL